ncbi:hypothetical protein GGR54DRAFT_597000 [Hypoxylon sp. NC1633]|nr:hypothetical protein GGR54DRAFT_597000 [Hypoxylon sp. NC1633]
MTSSTSSGYVLGRRERKEKPSPSIRNPPPKLAKASNQGGLGGEGGRTRHSNSEFSSIGYYSTSILPNCRATHISAVSGLSMYAMKYPRRRHGPPISATQESNRSYMLPKNRGEGTRQLDEKTRRYRRNMIVFLGNLPRYLYLTCIPGLRALLGRYVPLWMQA